jgi:hypothetical protein
MNPIPWLQSNPRYVHFVSKMSYLRQDSSFFSLIILNFLKRKMSDRQHGYLLEYSKI